MVAQVEPQSWMNGLTPMMPLAPSVATVSSAIFDGPQPAGIFGKELEPMSCMAVEPAVLPPTVMSAVTIGPQLNVLSAYVKHSTSGLLSLACCCGNAQVVGSTEARTLSPVEPVSTWMYGIVAQFVVLPGWQRVIVT